MGASPLTESQIAAIRSVPERGEAEAPTSEFRNPAFVYTDDAHYRLEQQKIFRRMPIPLTVSGMLPEPKMAYAHDGWGVPILLTRDEKGVAHAFLNACGHRGSRVRAAGEAEFCARLTCPYHAWTYSLGGQLVGVPRAEVFPTLDKSTRGLRRLPIREAGGIIWIGLDPDFEPDFTHATGPLAEDLAAFGLPHMHVYKRKSYDLPANWKIFVETFLEPYHVPPVHKNTVAQHFEDPLSVFAYMGPHSRQTTARVNYKRDAVDLDLDQIHKTVTHAYHLFPTTILVTSPKHFNFITVMPRSAGRSVVECYMVTKGLPQTDKEREWYERTFEFNMTTVFGEEDFVMAQHVQAGLTSGALKDVYFGGLEHALTVFHQAIDAELAK